MAAPHNRILLQSGTNEVEFLRFGLGSQLYGINVAKVRQVVVFESAKLCPLPDLPDFILGNYNYRGDLIPTIDLVKYFKIEPVQHSTPRLIVVLELNQCVLSIVIDSVDRIMRCSWNNFKQPEHSISQGDGTAVVGTAVVGDEMTPILDVEAILSELVPSASIETQDVAALAKIGKGKRDLRIVCCEDSNIVRKVLISSLEAAGYRNITTFVNGADAFKFLTTTPPPQVDVIVSDIEMPTMDGLTLCKQLRQNAKYGSVPFLFFSSTVNDQMRVKCSSVGGNQAFSKPQVTELVQYLAGL